MCGIVGYIGNRKAAPILIKGLKKLEYRGYDSAGICTLNDKEVIIKKDIGKIEEIDKKISLTNLEGNIGISHCRWATHGAVTKENAHPHTDCSGKILIVHNGIIENYSELKSELEKKGHKFKSETDTEIIAHLVEENYKGNLKEAVLKALKRLEGSYALGIIHSEHDELIAARNESPLIIGMGDGENFISSDVPAILGDTKKVVYLDNKEIAVLTKDNVELFDLDGKKKDKKVEEIEWNAEQAQKGGFEHFMLKEIFEQPQVISETINGRLEDSDVLINDEIKLSEKEIKEIKRIIIVACGTSWHAGLVGEFMIEELAKIPVEVEYASEFRYRDPIVDKNTVVIAISQSGETADTLAALREAKKKGAKIISIVNVKGSSIDRESDSTIYTRAGPEIGVASTKAFTSQLVVLYLITVYFGKVKGVLPAEQVRNRVRDLRKLPLQMQSVLEENDYIKLHAKQFYKKTNALYLGRGINYPIALEGALKLKEVSYIHAEGYPAAEMKHGPIALIDKEMPVVVIATKDNITYKKVLSNIQEVKSRGGVVIAIESKGDEEVKKIVDHNLYVPENSYILTPLLAVIPLQLFAYYVAVMRGCDVDRPRNLAKAVCVE
ncbi:MAG: glutamine--fructose-6-phosphate transaminase (isomerizing) [Nanoarchaeota archaeon]|nr:glutamine--fructose-6-phosphate transaminase (isomerizing) [Nanoarchaeota archaeon]MBU1005628.1 glutamine--fructose-6-phosphate transaminase (isomerizing) [Nanoarchaeota archaeon]MBU1946352.1 glutamine--fructose-6-phosphate transaminase (isomerizing) [Nanoarchaeota archaeon]